MFFVGNVFVVALAISRTSHRVLRMPRGGGFNRMANPVVFQSKDILPVASGILFDSAFAA